MTLGSDSVCTSPLSVGLSLRLTPRFSAVDRAKTSVSFVMGKSFSSRLISLSSRAVRFDRKPSRSMRLISILTSSSVFPNLNTIRTISRGIVWKQSSNEARPSRK